MQNANYFGMIKCKMPKFSWVCLVLSKMPNFSWGWVRAFWFLAFFCHLEAKIQNGEWISFCQKFCMVFSSILQNDGSKPKNFWMKWETKHIIRVYFRETLEIKFHIRSVR
jgi:hypothetical protein